MGHSPAYSFVTAVLLYVCYPLFTLSHDLHSFQVKMFVDDLQENIPNKEQCSLFSKNHILQQYRICKTPMSLSGYKGKKKPQNYEDNTALSLVADINNRVFCPRRFPKPNWKKP